MYKIVMYKNWANTIFVTLSFYKAALAKLGISFLLLTLNHLKLFTAEPLVNQLFL